MNSISIEFCLPLGLPHGDKYLKKGHMHLATTSDELEIQSSDDVGMNARYRDLMLLSRVIDDMEGLTSVSMEMLENLYETDFLYLQLLYKELNGETDSKIATTCPSCNKESVVSLTNLFQDMNI